LREPISKESVTIRESHFQRALKTLNDKTSLHDTKLQQKCWWSPHGTVSCVAHGYIVRCYCATSNEL